MRLLSMQELALFRKIIVCLTLIDICLVPTVKALDISPLSLDITVEKGKETEITSNVQVLNSDNKPIHVVGSVSGSVAQFITLDPQEFDIPAGPGAHSELASPYQYVTVIFKVPREVPESIYTGKILFKEMPTAGGVLTTSVQLGINVNLRIGTMATAEFPVYVNAMLAILVLVLIISIAIFYKRGKE
ncbi:MAG: hypothetical protein QMD36_03855 [Candidatus Aenigmarchaeota archaeon]|nr:hypothetical protein [Candidatus Aenigmarchaeota archaeon]